MMRAQQVEAFADAGQHAERQHVDLQDAERVDIVLVPFDEGAVGHRAVADRHGLGQRPSVRMKPPTCCDRWRGMPIICSVSGARAIQMRIGKVEPASAHALLVIAAPP
jgi:hypothetical protein